MNATHVPTPWVLGGSAVIMAHLPERDTPVFIATLERGMLQRANAEFLLRAVNAHDDLVAALKSIAEVVGDIPESWSDNRQCVTSCGHFRRARAAIAKAEGRS